MENCKHPSCYGPVLAKGYCALHYQRARTGKPMDVDLCSICGGPLRADHTSGICKRTPACKAARNKKYFEDNKDAILQRQKDWYKENSERLRPKYAKYRRENPEKIADSKRRSQYGLKPGEYETMLEAQKSCCAGCGRDDVKLDLDHNHACCPKPPTCGNCNRGLLCNRCNRAMGFVYDNPGTLEALATYLRRNDA